MACILTYMYFSITSNAQFYSLISVLSAAPNHLSEQEANMSFFCAGSNSQSVKKKMAKGAGGKHKYAWFCLLHGHVICLYM